MTLRSTQKPSTGRPLRAAQDPEERFQRWVTIGFIALIVIVPILVLAAFAYGYWDSNLRAVATVGGTSLNREQWRGRAALESARLEREEGQIRTALAAGQIDEEQAASALQSISAARQSLGFGSLDRLIDLTLQSQLADERGVSVNDPELEAALDAEGSTPERRRVRAIIIEPEAARFGAQPTPDQRREAFSAAQAAVVALASGQDFERVVAEYSTDEASRENGGDIGTLTADDAAEPVWTAALFDLEVGGVTPALEVGDASYRIGTVTEIIPSLADPTVRQEVERAVGAGTLRDNVRLETLAERLETSVVDEELSVEVPQVRLAEIFLEGDPLIPAEEDEGRVRASHILFSPNDDPAAASGVAEDDPAWTEAQAAAEAMATELRAIADPAARGTAFAERARTESDDTSGEVNGGDLGYFSRDEMVPEFADPLFDAEGLVAGDIVGPVRSQFGWHVIQFADRVAPLAERLEAAQTLLDAPAADFAAVASEVSEGAEAAVGGELGWRIVDELDDSTAVAVAGLEPGQVSAAVALDDGYHIYKLIETAERALDPEQRAAVRAFAFEDWYEERRSEAEDAGRLERDATAVSL